MDNVTASAAGGTTECPLVSEDMEGICVMPDLSTIKTEQSVGATPDDTNPQNVAMGIKFILPNRFDMNVCSRFVKSLNEEDSKNIQDQVNSDLEVASVLFKAECNIQTSPSPGIQVRHVYTPSTTKHFSPIKQSTTLTNKHRGNEVSSTPLLVHSLSIHQLAAQGEMVFLASRIEQETVINLQDEEGFTPLMWAAAHGQIAVVEFLLQNGADPNLLAKGRESALSLACSKGYTDIVKMLIDCGVDVNEYDWPGRHVSHCPQLPRMMLLMRLCRAPMTNSPPSDNEPANPGARMEERLSCTLSMATMCAVLKSCWKVVLILPLNQTLDLMQWIWLWLWAIEMFNR
ncbi:ankyrin repeat family A protein 2 isoform X1 [Melanotaenia boesemani]|uniref:ankyrin repeat family A protein 2 isoform X1 n=1 Tax=Melanotaenia boesemani TaxID=1250792 RepID=UPI001C04751F|nr:ankyrin repeat family A protein 2 isoform X1 [Melanotaenia boesemani]